MSHKKSLALIKSQSLARARFIEFMRTQGLSNKTVADMCGVTYSAVTEMLSNRSKGVPNYWLSQMITAYNLDSNYFFHKDATLKTRASEDSSTAISVPLLGSVAASYGKESWELSDEEIIVPSILMPKTGPVFALRASGDSMVGAGIIDKDICIIKGTKDAAGLKNDEIVVFRVDGETTIKYFERIKNHIWLKPANPTLKPLLLTAKHNVEVIGKLHSLMRPAA